MKTKVNNFNLIIAHYLTGGIALVIAMIMLVFSAGDLSGHFFQPSILGITHLLVLGWMTPVIMGALYQLLPVILETELYSSRSGYFSLILLWLGLPHMVISFYTFNLDYMMIAGGSFMLLSIGLFTINIYRTISHSPSKDVAGDFINLSVIWLLITVVLGFVLALNLKFAFLPLEHLHYLKIHAHVGAAGWFISLIMGVASKLIPMFSISHGLSDKKLKFSLWFTQAGLLVLFTGILPFRDIDFSFPAYVMISLGIIIYLWHVIDIFNKRIRKKLELNMKVSYFAFVIILFPIILAGVAQVSGDAGPSWFTAYGILIFMGFIGTLILAQTFKTLPFILWLAQLQPLGQDSQIPLPKDIPNKLLLIGQYLFYIPGTFLLAVAAGLGKSECLLIASVFLLAAAVAYLSNMVLSLNKTFSISKNYYHGKAENCPS